MKENTNIEKLFREKFENFQPQIDPSVWAGIQAGIGSSVAATGISSALKIGLVSGGIIAASVVTWYFGFYEPGKTVEPQIEQKTEVTADNGQANNNEAPVIVVNDVNDPVIDKNRERIEDELRNSQSNNSGSGTNEFSAGNSNEENNGNIIENQVVVVESQYTENNTVVVIEDVQADEKRVPTARMEYVQAGNNNVFIVNFISNADNHKEVRWYFGDGTEATGNEVKHTFSKPGKYTVKMLVIGLDKINYEESQELIIRSKSSIDNVPNVITPNGDRINDVFSIRTTEISDFMITIRDEKGNEVFTSNDKDFTWDGADYSGNVVEKGIYNYMIIAEGEDGSVIKLPGILYVE